MPIAILVPAFRPEADLLRLVESLASDNFPIIVIDDGSGPAYRDRFAACQARGATVLSHAMNQGKGAALKTGFQHFLKHMPDVSAAVTVDADGQHHPDDVRLVVQKTMENPDSLILGARNFGGDVPARSRFGNLITRRIYSALLGQSITDTQTGLRGVPRALLPALIGIKSTRYEFELDALIAARNAGVGFIEVPIRTIYNDNNASSHFRPVRDSMRVSFVLVRFVAASLLTAVVDNLVFALTFYVTGTVWTAQLAGRSVAVVVNYSLARTTVFRSNVSHREALPRYLALVAIIGFVSYFLINLIANAGILPVLAAKIAVECLLFYGNFLIQRSRIFKPRPKPSAVTDWTGYYQAPAKAARFSRRYTTGVLIRALKDFAGCSTPGHTRLVEVGGANSCFLDAVMREVRPSEYHVIDSNHYGMDLLESRVQSQTGVVLHRADIRSVDPGIEADVVFSVGLIEHFDEPTTRAVIDEHFKLVKPGGYVILSYPTPTALYRLTRALAELLGIWKFHDERPLQTREVARAAERNGVILWQRLIWPIVLTQHLIVVRKHT